MTDDRSSQLVPWETIAVVSVDVDGTLYDAKRAIRRFVLRVLVLLVTLRFRAVFEEAWSVIKMYQARKKIHEVHGDYAFTVDPDERALAMERTSRFYAPEVGKVGLRPGVRETLVRLRDGGLRVVAFSDYYSDAKLRALGVHNLFDAVYAAEATGHLKPHPTGFFAVCEGEGIAPQQLLHVGDRDETDGAGARSAGAATLILRKDFTDFRQFPLP